MIRVATHLGGASQLTSYISNMARRKITYFPGNYYHIFNRGVNREPIFKNPDNYIFLLQRIGQYALSFQVSIIAYCLMPNHYHLLLRQDGDQLIANFIQAVFNSYSKAFNKAFRRTGRLFESPYRVIQINDSTYLIHLCRYIHRNPLEAKLVHNLIDWPYSNYPEWIGKRSGKLVDREFVSEFFPNISDYYRFVIEYTPPAEIEKELEKLSLE